MKRHGRQPVSSYDAIFAVVRRVPHGRVATYGQVAQVAGLAGRARLVGYALHSLHGASAVPWQRVVNASGAISLAPMHGGVSQRLLLEREGVRFDARDRIDLRRYQWRPRGPAFLPLQRASGGRGAAGARGIAPARRQKK